MISSKDTTCTTCGAALAEYGKVRGAAEAEYEKVRDAHGGHS